MRPVVEKGKKMEAAAGADAGPSSQSLKNQTLHFKESRLRTIYSLPVKTLSLGERVG